MSNSHTFTWSVVSRAALVALASCGISTQYVPLNRSPHPMVPRLPADVQIFADNRPSRSFAEVGLIEVQQESRSSSTAAELLAAMRDEASRQGCEAILLQGANDSVTGLVVGSSGSVAGSTSTQKGYRAICIVFNDDPAPAPTAVQDPHIGPTL